MYFAPNKIYQSSQSDDVVKTNMSSSYKYQKCTCKVMCNNNLQTLI